MNVPVPVLVVLGVLAIPGLIGLGFLGKHRPIQNPKDDGDPNAS